MLEQGSLAITDRHPDRQLLLHCHPADVDALGRSARIQLSSRMLTSVRSGDWHVLHLAPDEWLLVSHASGAALDDLTALGIPHSLVDVSERTAGRHIVGADATAVLSAACALDLERLAVDYCTRTLLGKITAMIWRREDGWRVDFPRSYEGYVDRLLSIATTGIPVTA